MITTLLIAIPLLAAAVAAVWPHNRTRPWLLPAAGLPHAAVAWLGLVRPPVVAAGAWVGFDPVARAVLPAVALLFCACSAYGVAYLAQRAERDNRVFVCGVLALLGLMSLALQAQHLGLLWIAVEGGTLATVPLLHFNRSPRAYEATWKYLLIGGTGVALSLLGTFFLGYASLDDAGRGELLFTALAERGELLARPWVRAGWILLLVGYGTKMGLAPMHAWKPDAYGEAPGMIGALLAGGLTTVAFTGLLRVRQVIAAAGESVMADRTWMTLGLLSMVAAALFLLGARHFKRMLAYSGIEHMGILSVGAALGGPGLWAALFHVWSNTLTKGALFLAAGNMRRAADAQGIEAARGLARLAPLSTRIFVAGIFAMTACPPFAPFFSELRIVRTAFASGQGAVGAAFLLCLLVAFFGLTRLAFAVADGRPTPHRSGSAASVRESPGVLAPPLLLLAFSLWLGLFTPAPLREAWSAAVVALGGVP